jgi:hypothetical protein
MFRYVASCLRVCEIRILGLAGHLFRIGDLRNTYKILLRNHIVDGYFAAGMVVRLTVLFASPTV